MESKIRSVLIPTDFSELSESALNIGISIAKRQKANAILLYVLDSFTYLQPSEVMLQGMGLPADIVLTMENKIKELSEKISKKSGVKVTGKVLEGLPFERICRLAYEEQISLIVIGTHGTSGIRKFFMGSDSYGVVKNAPCPVLTVPGKWNKKEFKKVLFPIRLTPGALDKYFYSRPIIEKNNSEVFLFGLTDMKNPENIKELILLIENLKHQLHNDNIRFQTSYSPVEDFPSAINKTINEFKIDLLILTANFDNDWKSVFVGPFVQQVINHSQVPVLSIKPPDDKIEQVEPLKLAEKWGRSLKLSTAY